MTPEARFARDFTADDRQWLAALERAMRPAPVVSMQMYLELKASEDAAAQLAQSLGVAYEHLEAECAEAHRAAKRARESAERWRFVAVMAIAWAVGWMVAERWYR